MMSEGHNSRFLGSMLPSQRNAREEVDDQSSPIRAKGIGEIHDKGQGLRSGKSTAPGIHPDDPRVDAIVMLHVDPRLPTGTIGITPGPVNAAADELQSKLDDIFTEGVAARHARHADLNAMVHQWALDRGFDFFAPEGYRSKSLTCVANNRNIDVPEFLKRLKERHSLILDGGYGKLKGKTFRISNMGDETPETISALIAALDDCLPA